MRGAVHKQHSGSGVGFAMLEIRSDQIELLSIPLILETSFLKVKSSHLYKDGLVSPLIKQEIDQSS
jgi:hypothetical protein